MDDFGTGYSSLSYLHRFPLDTLKIDQSFVGRISDNGENAEVVRTIISLAQNLKLEVVAEGIETLGQLSKLRQLGCDYGQGTCLRNRSMRRLPVTSSSTRRKRFWM